MEFIKEGEDTINELIEVINNPNNKVNKEILQKITCKVLKNTKCDCENVGENN